MLNSCAAWVEAIARIPLLDPAQLQELTGSLQTCCPDPSALVEELQQRGWLTSYQVEQLQQGQGQQLLLGSYLVLEPLGQGGMGRVFKARNRRSGAIVALKVIHPHLWERPEFVRRFRREMRAAAQLAHPNIVTTYQAEQLGNKLFLAMEFCNGLDLGRLVRRSGPLPVGQACAYLREAALGLQHVHEQGMVHRDIKPENLLIHNSSQEAGPETIKIVDLGLVRLRHDVNAKRPRSSTPLTPEGTIMGTPDYLAPEQTQKVRFADIRSDLYSLGCTFYYLLGGQVPFPGGSPFAKLLRHRLEQPLPLKRLRPEVPPGVLDIQRRLMAKNPAERYPAPALLATALEPFATMSCEPADGSGSLDKAIDLLSELEAPAPLPSERNLRGPIA